ncbi:MAG: 8-amino-7-oxononanoate synthase [bacterium]|nr:8-amino-7-oxononanoate synthase [bacterium]
MVREIADQRLSKIREGGTYRSLRELSGPHGTQVVLNGREVLLFAGSNYLDLSHHPEVVEGAAQAARDYGCAAGGSRLISGNLELHEAFEVELAAFTGCDAALLFNSGYAANLGIIPALVGPDDFVVSDSLNHASIIDGVRLSRAQSRVFPHGDCAALDKALSEVCQNGARALVPLDGVFSMDGDIAPLSTMVEIAHRHGAMVLLDDAHGTGTLGEGGRGSAAHCGVVEEIDIQLGNLAKGLGSFGAFVAGSRELRELLINVARSFIFTCALPPPQVGAGRAALRILREEPWRRWQLQCNAAHLRQRLAAAGISTEPSQTHIVPVVLGGNERTMKVCEQLLAAGFYVQGIRHPSVPRGTARLRVTPMATHTPEQIDALADALVDVIERNPQDGR